MSNRLDFRFDSVLAHINACAASDTAVQESLFCAFVTSTLSTLLPIIGSPRAEETHSAMAPDRDE